MTDPSRRSRSRPSISVAETELLELRHRLGATKWPQAWPESEAVPAWGPGTDLVELRRLVTYWATDFDWRRQEAAINELPWHQRESSGGVTAYLRFEGESEDPFPLILTNGWPSTFLELVELARRLSRPSDYGAEAAIAFSVIVPCLPGFPFSDQDPAIPTRLPTHELWHEIMLNEFGDVRYGAHGGDLGAGTTSRLAQAHPESLAGIHLLSVADPLDYDAALLTAEEREYLDRGADWFRDEGAYEHQQMSRPATLSVGLSDSPAGLLAWIVEKYRAWSDHGGTLSATFSDDLILTQASLYWFTNCISTSFRPYYEHAHAMTQRVRKVTTPTAVAVFPRDLSQPPRSWAQRTYNVVRYTTMPRGGHFAPHEQPDLLAQDLREFFRGLRPA